MIFVSGIHGVGKTFFCNAAKTRLGINSYSSSRLIEEKKNSKFSVEKIVDNIDENQLYLLAAIEELREKKEEFILDGHFCLLKEGGEIARISIDTYTNLRPDKIVLLMEKPKIIAERRLVRDGIRQDEEVIHAFQDAEKNYAEEVAKILGIPLLISRGSSDVERILENICIGGL